MKPLLSLSLLLCSAFAVAQTATDITAEPHHHLLLQSDEARVFSFTLPPSEQAHVRYEHNFLFVPIQDGELVIWSEGTSPVPHYLFHPGEVHLWMGGQASGMRNDRPTDFRAVIVEFLNPKVVSYQYDAETGGLAYAGGGVNLPVDPHTKFIDTLAMGAASASDVQLLAGDSLPPPPKEADELLIAVSDLNLKGRRDAHIRKSPGELVWITAGRNWDLTNASSKPARFAAVAFWKQSGN